ncbi:BspA family leucine-rich repeat surface protein [Vibrio splendidus]
MNKTKIALTIALLTFGTAQASSFIVFTPQKNSSGKLAFSVEKKDATIISERVGVWSVWADVGSNYNCDSWTPAVETITIGSSFTQTRDCNQDQGRTRNIYNVYSDGSETLKETETESKITSETKSQSAIGTKNVIETEREGDWGKWIDIGSPVCDSQTATPSTEDYQTNETFNQTQDCTVNQKSYRNVYNVYSDGSETLNRVEEKDQKKVEKEVNLVSGTCSHTRAELDQMIDNNIDYSNACTQNITDFRNLFTNKPVNFSVVNWDVSSGSKMSGMFGSGTQPMSFNQDISNWDVSNATDFGYMFKNRIDFNQDLSKWNVTSKMRGLEAMFMGASSFNSNISGWDVSNVYSFIGTFDGATSFRQNLSGWDTSNVFGFQYFSRNSGFTSYTDPYLPPALMNNDY